MNIIRRHFPETIPDNDEIYLLRLQGLIESIDELSSLQITRKLTGYEFRLSPSIPKYIDLLISEILAFHNLFKIRIDMSKSIKTSVTIAFSIILE